MSAGAADGFTLLEILVALVIFALAFGVLAQIIQTGLRQSAGSSIDHRRDLARPIGTRAGRGRGTAARRAGRG